MQPHARVHGVREGRRVGPRALQARGPPPAQAYGLRAGRGRGRWGPGTRRGDLAGSVRAGRRRAETGCTARRPDACRLTERRLRSHRLLQAQAHPARASTSPAEFAGVNPFPTGRRWRILRARKAHNATRRRIACDTPLTCSREPPWQPGTRAGWLSCSGRGARTPPAAAAARRPAWRATAGLPGRAGRALRAARRALTLRASSSCGRMCDRPRGIVSARAAAREAFERYSALAPRRQRPLPRPGGAGAGRRRGRRGAPGGGHARQAWGAAYVREP
jgi:hypothetical protein